MICFSFKSTITTLGFHFSANQLMCSFHVCLSSHRIIIYHIRHFSEFLKWAYLFLSCGPQCVFRVHSEQNILIGSFLRPTWFLWEMLRTFSSGYIIFTRIGWICEVVRTKTIFGLVVSWLSAVWNLSLTKYYFTLISSLVSCSPSLWRNIKTAVFLSDRGKEKRTKETETGKGKESDRLTDRKERQYKSTEPMWIRLN